MSSDLKFLYWDNLILRFNRLKTTEGISKYSNIELEKNKYITFYRFCNECEEYFSRRYSDEPTEETIQEIFDKLN